MRRMGAYTAISGTAVVLLGLFLNAFLSSGTDVPDILVIVGLFILIAGIVISVSQGGIKGARIITVVQALAGSTVLLLILIAGNIISDRFSLRRDLTRTGRFTLSDQTKTILSGLERDVLALGFFPGGDGMEARDLLTEYDAASDRFSFRFLDPDRNPEQAEQYMIREYGTVVFESEDRRERITDHTEDRYTSAIARLMSDEKAEVVFVTGHGERRIADSDRDGFSSMATRLEDEGFTVGETMIMRDGLPSRDAVMILAGPRTPLLPSEAESLDVFISRGGRIICCLEPDGTPLAEFLPPRGVTQREDTIIDASGLGSLFGMSEVVPLVATYDPTHAITSGFDAATFFPLCRSLAVADTISQGFGITCLAFTSEASWGDTGGGDLDEVIFDVGTDHPGPLCVFALIEPDSPAVADSVFSGNGWAVAVFGDVDFAGNGYCDVSANGDLFMNTVSWMSRRERLIGIRPKKSAGGPIMLSSRSARSIFLLVIILLPGIPLISGISLWVRGRSRP